MKRYRIVLLDFDTSPAILGQDILEEWSEDIKRQHLRNKEHVEENVLMVYGIKDRKSKKKNFIEFGSKSFSILAFHNRFFEQIRTAYVMGAYYPALTASCALGERILNHLLITLRDDFKFSPEYKRIYNKRSLDDWDLAINTLDAWGVLLPSVVASFRQLKDRRNKAIHFRPEIDRDDQQLAIEAIQALRAIIFGQFPAFGNEPWFLCDIPGEMYIKKEWEERPFIKKVYLPNCLRVGPKHQITELSPPRVTIMDDFPYDDREISDEEFSRLRKEITGNVRPNTSLE